LVYESPVSIGLLGKIENGNALRLLLIQKVKGFQEELKQLVLLPFATTQQKDCRRDPAVFI
jgi:hypothetical protein